jgi:hypothetical protein
MTTIKESSRDHLTLVHVFHAYASTDTPWVAHALSHASPVRYGRVSFNSATIEASKFAGPKKITYAPVHNSKLVHSDPTDAGLNQHRPLNIKSDHSSSFPFNILHFLPITPPGLQLCQHFHKSTYAA